MPPSGVAPSNEDAGLEAGRTRAGTQGEGHHISATAAIRQLFSTEDPSALFRQLDEDYIKPTLLLDGGGGGRGGGRNDHDGGGAV